MTSTGRITVCLLLILPLIITPLSAAAAGGMTTTGRRIIIGDDTELELGGGMTMARRVLDESGYIGYGALRADSTPCDQRGASYYNCRPGAEANPYDRGCSTITLCRS